MIRTSFFLIHPSGLKILKMLGDVNGNRFNHSTPLPASQATGTLLRHVVLFSLPGPADFVSLRLSGLGFLNGMPASLPVTSSSRK
jgi:hypothetical protein